LKAALSDRKLKEEIKGEESHSGTLRGQNEISKLLSSPVASFCATTERESEEAKGYAVAKPGRPRARKPDIVLQNQ
jgi:hypothetical protein